MSADLQRAVQSGIAALQAGNGAVARAAFEQVERAGRATPQLRVLLARACFLAGDAAGAARILDAAMVADPGNISGLILRGDMLAAGGDDRAASSWYQAALDHAPRVPNLPHEIRADLARVERAVAAGAARFRRHLDAALAAGGASRAGARFAEAVAILAGEAEPQLQRPTSFYYPRLPQIPFYDAADFAWVPALEAEADRIRAELGGVLAGDLSPYVEQEAGRPAKRHALLGDPRWSAFHLWRAGMPVAGNAERCPATMAALERLPIPRIEGRSPMAMFSVLRPGTHIPPHHGMLNTRLICHLPLVVPDGCRLRVGNETRPVVRDRMIIFDDSIEHEAWNDGDETRVVLLFEIWRPELDAAERAALTTLFASIGSYGGPTSDQAGA